MKEAPFGLTYGQWTVKWWQWVESVPKDTNPLLDDTGRNSNVDQDGPVWFLAGTVGDQNYSPHRICVIPNGKAILFPVINYEINPLEKPELKDDIYLIKHVIDDMDDITIKEAFVDGEVVPIYRVRSDPIIFPLNINQDNGFNIPGGYTKAAADGYWVFLKELSRGQHDIQFHGSCSGGARKATAEYHIRII